MAQSASPTSNSDSSSEATSSSPNVTSPTSRPSPKASSSSISFESSCPSSSSSHSSPPPTEPRPKGASSEIELSKLSGVDESGKETSIGRSRHSSDSTVTVSGPANSQNASSTSPNSSATKAHGGSVFSRMQTWMSKRQWFGNSVGLITLLLTLVGLVTIGTHTYELDKLNEYMAYLQVCLSKKQINATLDADCQAAIALPVPKPPHKLITRALNSTSVILRRIFVKRDSAEDQTPRWQREMHRAEGVFGIHHQYPHMNMHDNSVNVVMVLMSILPVVLPLVLGVIVLMKHLRRTSRVQEVFSSPARNEVQILRHHPDGSDRLTSSQGVRMIKHNPEEQHFLGQLRQSIRHILERDPEEQDAIAQIKQKSLSPEEGEAIKRVPLDWVPKDHLDLTSALESSWTTNRNSRRPSNVTIRSRVDGEDQQQEGLIELKTKGSNKTFFDPTTGEFIRLTPWKAGVVVEDDDKIQGDEKGNTKKALVRMGTGAVAFAGGKSLDEEIIEELDRDDVFGDPDRVPQRVGDSLAGLVTNE